MFNPSQPQTPPQEVQQEATPQAPPAKPNAIYEFLESIGGPNEQQVEQWKADYGAVHMLPFNDDTVIIYRTLRRIEWNAMKIQFQAAGESMTDDLRKEQIVTKCLLWPKLDSSIFARCEAGLVDSVYSAIELSSFFLSPQMVMNMVIKL